MAEAITFFIESAHLMKELVPLLMYLSVDSTIIIIYYYYWGFSVGEAACTRAHAAGRSRTEEVEVGRGLPPSRGRRPTGGGSACPAPQLCRIKEPGKPFKAGVARRDRALVRSI